MNNAMQHAIAQPDDNALMGNPMERRYVYGRVFRMLHWLMVALVFSLLLVMGLREYLDDPDTYKMLTEIHRSLGLLTLLTVLFRLCWRLYSRDYPYTGISRINQFLASSSHAVFYVSLTLLPLLGWLEGSARGVPIRAFGTTIPALMPKNRELMAVLNQWHVYLGLGLAGLIVLHISAALMHFAVKRDGVLYAMLPIRWLRPPWAHGKK